MQTNAKKVCSNHLPNMENGKFVIKKTLL